jgi:predicted DNA binding CopG/RHH family protein
VHIFLLQSLLFRSEAEEQEFWSTHDSTDFLDWNKAGKALFPNLKPTMKTISLRLPEPMLNHLKVLANERDVPYQSLLIMFLKERLDQEFS